MRKIKNITLILATLLLFAACDKDPVTYRFEKEDEAKLLPHYTVGKILTFRNEVGEERKFEVTDYAQNIWQDWENVGMGGADMYYFFYESKGIHLLDISSQKKFGIAIRKYPIDLEKARNNIHKKYKSRLVGSFADQSWNMGQNQSSRTVNSIIYNNVIEIQRSDFSSIYLFYDVIVMYYDIYQGLIEFQDKNNHQWKLAN
ncbi:MAG: hypothetical protein LBU51_01570 [Bacteroidales bacterium]|jgi:hypothetical protein|nr:hypothetical protein [Bacteroidales bacterium]